MKRDIAALMAFLNDRQAVPYAWGRKANDCMAFIAGAVKAQTGKDPAVGLKWTDERSAIRLLKKLGGTEKALDARFERIPPALAMRGDIAGVPDDRLGIHPMIVEGTELVSPGDKGNRRIKRSAMTVAWSAVRQKPRKKKP